MVDWGMKTLPAPARKGYPSDLRDEEWAVLEPLVPAVKSGGRPARHTRREIVNAILYVVQGGNQWRAMPHDLPPWQTAYYYFRMWRNDGTWETIYSAVRDQARKHLGREAAPRLQLPTPDLQLVRLDHAPALLAFERENRAYFAASVPDRGNEFFAEFDTRHAQLLERQAAGTDYFYVLVTEGGEVVGRVNLFEVADGSAELGYRIAQKAAGQGLAKAAVRQMRELAATAYGLTRLRARVTLDNPASRNALEHNGFVAVGELTLNGKPAISYICELR